MTLVIIRASTQLLQQSDFSVALSVWMLTERHGSFHQNWDVNHCEHIRWCHFLNTELLNTSIDLCQPWNQIKLSDTRCRGGKKILTTKLAKILYRLCHTKYDVLPCSSQSRVKSGTILHHMSFQAFNTHLLIHKDYLLQCVPTSLQLHHVKGFFFLSENIPMFLQEEGKA